MIENPSMKNGIKIILAAICLLSISCLMDVDDEGSHLTGDAVVITKIIPVDGKEISESLNFNIILLYSLESLSIGELQLGYNYTNAWVKTGDPIVINKGHGEKTINVKINKMTTTVGDETVVVMGSHIICWLCSHPSEPPALSNWIKKIE